MTDTLALIHSIESGLMELTRHASTLATGLQNAAPGSPSHSVLYLLAMTEYLQTVMGQCRVLLSLDEKEQKQKLLALLREATEREAALREEHQIQLKFRFVKDQVASLLSQVEAVMDIAIREEIAATGVAGEGEDYVYVYLFNAQGAVLQMWQKALNASVLYELSVNRPIYSKREEIESFISHKERKLQHAYLTVIVRKQDIIQVPDLKDANGNTLVKVREGSLQFGNVVGFMHNGLEYAVDEDGRLSRK